MIKCAGFIILNETFDKTVLVRTQTGHLSFPKGGRALSEIESVEATAYRELKEETGLTEKDISIWSKVYVDEFKKNSRIRYFIATTGRETMMWDKEELEYVGWYKCEDVFNLDNLNLQRKDILRRVLDLVQMKPLYSQIQSQIPKFSLTPHEVLKCIICQLVQDNHKIKTCHHCEKVLPTEIHVYKTCSSCHNYYCWACRENIHLCAFCNVPMCNCCTKICCQCTLKSCPSCISSHICSTSKVST